LRPGVGALVRADAAGAVILDPNAGEEALARVAVAVRARGGLRERPPGRLRVADEDVRALPVAEQRGGVGVRVEVAVRLGQVDLDAVVGRAGGQAGRETGLQSVCRP